MCSMWVVGKYVMNIFIFINDFKQEMIDLIRHVS